LYNQKMLMLMQNYENGEHIPLPYYIIGCILHSAFCIQLYAFSIMHSALITEVKYAK